MWKNDAKKITKGEILKSVLNRISIRMCSLPEDALIDLAAQKIKFCNSLQRVHTIRQKKTDEYNSRCCENSLLTIRTILIPCIYKFFCFCMDRYNPSKENYSPNNF